ncbi:MAG TPA: phosphoribosyltransferase family protein [Nitrososphaeraceae archaeon]|jgi:predicted phosphoribosyltransferase
MVIFEKLVNKIQLRFKDRVNAANILSAALKDLLDRDELKNSLVLGIPRGGIIVADIVVSKLASKHFDIIIPRKMAIPHNEEVAFGAVMEDGTAYINKELISSLKITQDYIESEIQRQLLEIKRRGMTYRKRESMLREYKQIFLSENIRNTILVDDGVATGATLIVAAKWIKQNFKSTKIIVAATVAPRETVETIQKEIDPGDLVEVTIKPDKRNFKYVGQFYKDFDPVVDEQVIQIMNRRGLLR